MTADLTWYDWSSHPGPFLQATPVPVGPDDPTNAALFLNFAPREDFGFRNIVQPRMGAEYRIMDDTLAFRAGYSHRPSVAPLPCSPDDTGQCAGISNVLDGTVNSVSFGAGYRLGTQPPEDEPVREGGDEHGQPLPGLNDELTPQYGINGTIDLYFRASLMKDRNVERPDRTAAGLALDRYSFGGKVIEIGGTFSLGWF